MEIAAAFEQTSAHRIRISSGSTGKLFAPIQHGSPFDVFLSADRERDDFHHLAIANPSTAPYGTATHAVLQKLHRWDAVQTRLVTGEIISQTFQFIHTGNAELSFVALAQVFVINAPQEHYWLIPSNQHPSLEQQAVLLRHSQTATAAREFLNYLQSKDARDIIARDGYEAP